MFKKLASIFYFFIIALSLCYQSDIKAQIKDFYLVTIPKSGSHLMIKLIVMLTNRYPEGLSEFFPHLAEVSEEEFEQVILTLKHSNHFPFNHTGMYGKLFAHFSEQHPEYARILMIRDLKDVLLSYTHHISKSLEEQFGSINFDEKLRLVLDLENSQVSAELEQDILEALRWKNRADVLVYSFEDIVGEPGNGDAYRQEESVKRLAAELGVAFTPELYATIKEELFGNRLGPQVSGTFRSGKIGNWKAHFTAEHLQLFEKNWQHYNRALGYKDS